jgi:hypothetical protein
MDDQVSKFKDLSTPLILTNLITSIPDKSVEILKIRDLIQIKYFNKINSVQNNKFLLNKNLMTIIKEVIDIDNDVQKKTSLINETIKYQETKLKKLYDEKKLLEQNKIQSDIIKNQQKLIDNHKQNIANLTLTLSESEKKLNEKDISNRKLLINNAELKNTISRYIVHNKKLQENIIELKAEYSTISLTKLQIDEMTSKINFYQEENIRLSSEIIIIQKDYESIQNNFIQVENEKNNIYKQIKELNNSLIKNNIVGTPFLKEKIKEVSINTKVLNDIINKNLVDEKKKLGINKNLNEQISDIFN